MAKLRDHFSGVINLLAKTYFCTFTFQNGLLKERGERMAFMIAEGTANGLDLEAPLRYKLEQIYLHWFDCHDPSSKSSAGDYCKEHKNRKRD